jgi:protein subunit release factor A
LKYTLSAQWKWLLERSKQLAVVLERPDLWEDSAFAGKVSREQGEIMGKIKSVNQFEQELMEHIDMLRLAREEGDNELEMVNIYTLLILHNYIMHSSKCNYMDLCWNTSWCKWAACLSAV